MSQPVSAIIFLIFFPPGPMISPILSSGGVSITTRGAYWESDVRGAEIALFITASTFMRAVVASSIVSVI